MNAMTLFPIKNGMTTILKIHACYTNVDCIGSSALCIVYNNNDRLHDRLPHRQHHHFPFSSTCIHLHKKIESLG